jgi:multiple sugar transport system permease protein
MGVLSTPGAIDVKSEKRDLGWVYAVLFVGALILVLPFVYMLETSLKSDKEASAATFSIWVLHPTLEAFSRLLSPGLVGQAAVNSLLIALATTAGNMYLAAMAGYAFAKQRFPGKDLLFIVLLATMMIPSAILLVPGFLLYRDLGWLDSWWPLIIPGICGSFSVFLARQFTVMIPDSLIEAAKIEGCGEGRLFHTIILPCSKSMLATIGILTFLGSWNSFIGPLIILLNEHKYTLPLVVAMLQGRYEGQTNVQMAGALISIAPVLILFFIFQKQIVQSLASSGLKEG